MQHHILFELLNHRFGLRFVGLFQVAHNVYNSFAIRNGHHNALVAVALGFVHLLDGGVGYLLQAVGFSLEGSHSHLEGSFFQYVVWGIDEFFFGEGAFHREYLNERLFATFVIVGLYDVDNAVPDNVGDVHADAFAHHGVASFLVNHGTLLVHHVVVFQQVLTNTEVVFLYLLLCTLNALRNHWAFDAFALFKSKAVHDACDAF